MIEQPNVVSNDEDAFAAKLDELVNEFRQRDVSYSYVIGALRLSAAMLEKEVANEDVPLVEEETKLN